MAADWIKMRSDLSRDPAVIAISGRLGIDTYAVIGRLHKLWSWFDEQTTNGHADVTQAWCDAYVDANGFAEMLTRVGWMTSHDDGHVSLPKFTRHCGKTAKKRALASVRQAKKRNAEVTQTSRKQRDKSVTREEKNRYKENKKRNADAFPEFWAAYPRKDAKQSAEKAWGRIDNAAELLPQILESVAAHKRAGKWDDPKFIPHAATWLNGGRWNDEIKPACDMAADSTPAGRW